MTDDAGMPSGESPALMCEVSEDRQTARVHLPPIRLARLPKPLRLYIDMDAEAVDDLMQQLAEVRAQMLPPPDRH